MAERTPQRFVREIAEAIEKRILDSQGRQYTVKKKIKTVVKECGRRSQSNKLMAEVQTALEHVGVYPHPSIDASPLRKPDDFIVFSDKPPSEVALAEQFTSERKLHKFVMDYYPELFSKTTLKNLRYLDSEARLDQGFKTLEADMLFEDPNGVKVVVEFKVGSPKTQAVSQLHNYMTLVAASGSHVRGVLITARPSTGEAARPIWTAIDLHTQEFDIVWYWYSLPIPLEKAARAS